MKFTGNVIIDKQEKSKRNLECFRAAMRKENPDVGFVEESLGNHRGDFALEVIDAEGSTNPHPEIRVETKWLSDRGPVDLFSSLSSGYERIKKEFEFLGSIKAPLFLAQGKSSDFAEYTTPGGVTWEKTLNVLFSLNARYRVPMVWTDDAPEFLAAYLASVGFDTAFHDKSIPLDVVRDSLVLEKPDQIHDVSKNNGVQFFCCFKCPNDEEIIRVIIDRIVKNGCGFWFFDDQDPDEMRDAWLKHEQKAVAIRSSGGFTPNPPDYNGAIRTFGPGKNQYLPRNKKTRQKRKASVAFDSSGENPIFLVFNPPKITGCEIEFLEPERLNGELVDPASITGLKDLNPFTLLPLGKVKDRSKNETEVIPDILRFLHKVWNKDEQKPEMAMDLPKFERFEDVVSALPVGSRIIHEEVEEIPEIPEVVECVPVNDEHRDALIEAAKEQLSKPQIVTDAPYPPLYVEKPKKDNWFLKTQKRLDEILKNQQLLRTEIQTMANLPAPIESREMLNVASPGDVEKALLEVCGLGKASPAMQIVALKMANRYGFSLELKHVIPVKGNLYITRDGLLHIAHKSGKLDGIEVVDEGKDPKGGWWAKVAVYRKDMSKPFTYKGRYNGPNKNFGPEMAIKCAESMCLRRAFDVSICSREERWDVEEVEKASEIVEEVSPASPVVSAPAPAPAPVVETPPQITVVASEMLDAKPSPDYGMRYDTKPEKSPSNTAPAPAPDNSKAGIIKTIKEENIPLEFDFRDGSPVVKIMEATAHFYGADSWAEWCPDIYQRVDAIQFLKFFGWVIKMIDFDAAFSLVEQGKVPAETGPDFMKDFTAEYKTPEKPTDDAIYAEIVRALTVVNVPF